MSDCNTDACTTVGKGGVGESGASLMIHHVVGSGSEKMMVLRTVDTSLCGNTSVVAVLVINGIPTVSGVLTKNGDSIQSTAKPGDNVVVVIHTVPLFNDIVCVRLGQLDVELDECELVA